MFFIYLLSIFTNNDTCPAIPVQSEIKSLLFKNKKGKHFAEISFYKPYHATQVYLMGSESGDPDNFMPITRLDGYAKYSDNGNYVTIEIKKKDLKKYLAFHFYNNNQYFSSEVFVFNNSEDKFNIYRNEGMSWWLIGAAIGGVAISIILMIIVMMRNANRRNRPIAQPDDDL